MWSVLVAGLAIYTTAIVLNYGNWKAMTLFLIAGLFGLGGVAVVVLKIVKKIKEIEVVNADLSGRILWQEHLKNLE